MSAIWWSSGTKITMEKPHLSGFTRDARAYELSADAAKQDLTKPDLVELQQYPRQSADAGQEHGGDCRRPIGVYDSKGETIKLDREHRADRRRPAIAAG